MVKKDRYELKEQILRFFLKMLVKLLPSRNSSRLFRMIYYATQILKEEIKMNNALILYYSKTGNTEKVANAIKRGLEKKEIKVTIKELNKVSKPDFYKYDLVCFGSPVIHSLPPSPVLEFLKKNRENYMHTGEIYLPAPKLANKNALIFVTYSGPHCGVSEALPVGKYIVQFFEHLGFNILDEWYEIGEFHGWDDGNKKGLMGDIRGRPNDEDLKLVELKTIQLTKML